MKRFVCRIIGHRWVPEAGLNGAVAWCHRCGNRRGGDPEWVEHLWTHDRAEYATVIQAFKR